jgi:hypothetical protein
MDKEPAAILVDIVRTYMSLQNKQIWQYNQEVNIADSEGLYVVIHYLTSIPISSSSSFEVDVNDIGRETIFSMSKEIYSVEIGSFDRSAISRKDEIIQALKGGYSQNQQAQYGFRLFPLPITFNNVSSQIGGNMLNRFMIDVALMVTRSSTRVLDYYTNFPIQLTSNA